MFAKRISRGVFSVLAVILCCNSCKTDGTTTVARPVVAIAASPSTFSLAQNATTGNTATITLVSRSAGFSGAVSLALSSNPAGITGTFNPASIPAGIPFSTLTINVGATQAVGSYTLTVTGSSTGVANASTILALTVTPATAIAPDNSLTTLSLAEGHSR